MRTVVTHIYNEEYLLPWWLNHHKNLFDHGVIIDYASTDRSVEICRDICPTWQIFPSINKNFNAVAVDDEVLQYEIQLTGWRMALTVTEFLVGNLSKLCHDFNVNTQYVMPTISFFDWNPEGVLDKQIPLWHQIKSGVTYKKDFKSCLGRSLHNFYFNYRSIGCGRHFHYISCTDAAVFRYSNSISSPEMLARRLQIQHKIPLEDRLVDNGWHHHNHNKGLDFESLKAFNASYDHLIEDCSSYIDAYT